MNKFTAFAFTMALSLGGGASTAFASNMNDQTPQAKDLSAQEMNSTVGASRIYWRTNASWARVFQADRDGHSRTIYRNQGWVDIGGHNIRTGTRVIVQCRSPTRFWQAQFTKRNYSVGIECN